MPKISVIIPVYGVEKYIERCVRSLFEQTLDDIEFIFVDDCTPDRSIEILRSIIEEYRLRFAEKKYEVRIVRMPTNSGLAAVRRHGIQLATGDYIIHCDSDDWVDVTMYEKMYNKAIEEQADMVVCGYRETDGVNDLRVGSHSFTTKDEYIARMLYGKETWTVWDKLCRRKLYEGIEYPIYSMGEDMLFTFQIVLKANNVSIVNEILYNYFFNPASITKVQSDEKRFSNWLQSLDNANKVLKILNETTRGVQYHNEIVVFKYYQKKIAGNLVWKNKYAKDWYSLYPEINSKVIISSSLSLDQKIKYYITLGVVFFKTIIL